MQSRLRRESDPRRRRLRPIKHDDLALEEDVAVDAEGHGGFGVGLDAAVTCYQVVVSAWRCLLFGLGLVRKKKGF